MLSLTINSLEHIEEVKMSFSVKFNLEIEWNDKNMDWQNLNDDIFLNIVTKDVVDKLWVPHIIFKNTEKNYESKIDEKSIILVKKQGNKSLAPIHEIEEIAYYKGSENSLLYSRDFYHRFQCHFDLHDYPFDTQVCSILMKMPHKVENFVDIFPKQLKYTGQLQMAEFNILKLDMRKGLASKQFDVEVKFILKRRIAQHLLSTYLPSFCILCIAQVLKINPYFENYLKLLGDFILCQGTFQNCSTISHNLSASDVHSERLCFF